MTDIVELAVAQVDSRCINSYNEGLFPLLTCVNEPEPISAWLGGSMSCTKCRLVTICCCDRRTDGQR